MPFWVHRTTFRQLASVAEADLAEPVANYVEEPDLSAVAGQPTKYWILTGDIFTLMGAAARLVADAAEEAARLDDVKVRDKDRVDTEVLIAALMKLVHDEINILRAQFNTTTAQVNQATNTSFSPRTGPQYKAQMKSNIDAQTEGD